MIRTIASIFITLGIIFGISALELFYVKSTFDNFHKSVQILYQKVENSTATYEDGLTVQTYWRTKKKSLHVWVPHNALQEMDYQLDEAVGYLYLQAYDDAIPKLEVVLGLSEHIPQSYTFGLENIF